MPLVHDIARLKFIGIDGAPLAVIDSAPAPAPRAGPAASASPYGGREGDALRFIVAGIQQAANSIMYHDDDSRLSLPEPPDDLRIDNIINSDGIDLDKSLSLRPDLIIGRNIHIDSPFKRLIDTREQNLRQLLFQKVILLCDSSPDFRRQINQILGNNTNDLLRGPAVNPSPDVLIFAMLKLFARGATPNEVSDTLSGATNNAEIINRVTTKARSFALASASPAPPPFPGRPDGPAAAATMRGSRAGVPVEDVGGGGYT